MPQPPADLAQRCSELPKLPVPFLDPERLEYEADIIALYGECAARHYEAVEAWKNAASSK